MSCYAVSLRAPKWYKRPVGVSFGFGGKVVSFHPRVSGLGTFASSEVNIVSKVCFVLLYLNATLLFGILWSCMLFSGFCA